MIDVFFTELILKYLKQQKRSRTIGIYYPSELPWCLRKLYYDYTIGRDKDLDTKLLMVSGNLIHSFISDVLEFAKKEGIEFQSEVEYEFEKDGIKIVGRADNVILIKSKGSENTYVVEVKSKSKLPDTPRLEHISQLNFYLYFNPNAKGYLLYITRDGFNMRAFEVNFSEKLFEELINRAFILHNHIINNTVPNAEFWHGECLRCVYRDICFKVK